MPPLGSAPPNPILEKKFLGKGREKWSILLYLFLFYFVSRKCDFCNVSLLYFAFETVLWPPFWRDDTPICFSKSLETLSWNADRDHVSYTSVFAASLTKVLKSLIFLCVTLWIRLYYLLFHVNKAYYNITT